MSASSTTAARTPDCRAGEQPFKLAALVSTQTSEEPRVRARRPPRIQPLQILSFVFIGIVAVWLVGNFVKSPSHWFDLFLLGLTLGMVYALIALGYSLVYGILELINFAHGDVFMLGAMMTVSLRRRGSGSRRAAACSSGSSRCC